MKRMLALVLACILLFCSCRPIEAEGTSLSGKVAGLIDNHTVEMLLNDGSIESFLFYDAEVGESILKAEESEDEITVVCVEKEGQTLKEIIRVE